MGGESRYFYHGVPRMISNTVPDELIYSLHSNSLSNLYINDKDWQDCISYIKSGRININARQVKIS